VEREDEVKGNIFRTKVIGGGGVPLYVLTRGESCDFVFGRNN